METTFDKLITANPKRKEIFDKEYNEFLLSEFVLEKNGIRAYFHKNVGAKSGSISDGNTKNTE